MRVLQIVRSAYRCNLEEQDDPAVWITRAMKGAGADLALLLRGNATNYAVLDQDASGLSIGGHAQSHAPRLDRDVAALVGGGTTVFVVREDLEQRGIPPDALVRGVEIVPRETLPRIMAQFEAVWHW